MRRTFCAVRVSTNGPNRRVSIDVLAFVRRLADTYNALLELSEYAMDERDHVRTIVWLLAVLLVWGAFVGGLLFYLR